MRLYYVIVPFSSHHGDREAVAYVYDADQPRMTGGHPLTRHRFVEAIGPFRQRARLEREIEARGLRPALDVLGAEPAAA
jgi:hypothetical protein